MNLKDRKNILIGSLLFVVLLMSVAFAAFTTNLTIHGTSSINSNWCVGFDSSKTSTYVATPGLSGATTPTGQMTYSGDTCQSSYKTIANLTSKFTQPGDKVVYTLTIANKSSMSAQIDSITLDGDSITSNTTVTKGNIKYTVEMPASTTLASNAETTMKVTAEFQNDTTIGNYTSSESASVDVRINTSEGNNGSTPTFTGTIYRNNISELEIGDSINGWCAVHPQYGNSCDFGYIWDSEAECLSANSGVTCQQGTLGDYTIDASTLNKRCYLKHDVVDNIIAESYVEFVVTPEIAQNNPGMVVGTYTLKGGDSGASFTDNMNAMKTAFDYANHSKRCYGDQTYAFTCTALGLNVSVNSGGDVSASGGNDNCYVFSGGSSHC